MAIEIVSRQDDRYDNLFLSYNARWRKPPAESASRIVYCTSGEDVRKAVEDLVTAGVRPTIRSGNHCYEDFVENNPGGAIVDLSLLDEVVPAPGEGYRIGAGSQVGDIYTKLYRMANRTIPAASCTGVGAGGHITGGGYGVLSRLHGITVDYVTAIDIVTVDAGGKATLRHTTRQQDPDLFLALLGGGGGNFGVITAYYVDNLPAAPSETARFGVSFSWDGMTEERFSKIIRTYGNYFETRGKDPDTWGLFTGMGLRHHSSGSFSVGGSFCNPDGTCKDLGPLNEFIDLFSSCDPIMAPEPAQKQQEQERRRMQRRFAAAGGAKPGSPEDAQAKALVEHVCTQCHSLARVQAQHQDQAGWTSTVKDMVGKGAQLNEKQVAIVADYLARTYGPAGASAGAAAGVAKCGPPEVRKGTWIDSAVRPQVGNLRAKYASCYMKKNFTPEEATRYYKWLTKDIPGVDLSGNVVSCDSYGGATNKPERLKDTCVAARGSVMKLQFISYWQDAAQDEGHIQWQREFFKDLYSGPYCDQNHKGAPYWSDRYEGCYINYPDRDMLNYAWWPELYYGEEMMPRLRQAKKKYDPNNVFHHAMSIRA